jgi:DNA-binding phage protein
VLEEEDDQLLHHALQDVAIALSHQSNQPVNLAHLDLSGLLPVLHALNLELSIQPRRKAA